MKKSKHTEAQITGAVKQLEGGRSVKELARELGSPTRRFAELRGEKPEVAHLKQIRTKEDVMTAVVKACEFATDTVRSITPEQLNRTLK